MNSSDRIKPSESRGRVSAGVDEAAAGNPPLDRQRLVNRFEVWLDEVLEQDATPSGMAQEILQRLQMDESGSETSLESCDLFSLWNAVVGLTQETRNHAGAAQELLRSLGPMATQVASMEKQVVDLGTTLDRQRSEAEKSLIAEFERILVRQQKAAEKAKQLTMMKEAAEALIDLRDSLESALERARTSLQETPPEQPPGFFKRLMGRPTEPKPSAGATEMVLASQAQGLERVEKVLAQWNIRPMDLEGSLFSPVTMRAVEQIDTTDHPDGTLLGILRPGYWQGKKVFRPAEVRVARNQTELESQ